MFSGCLVQKKAEHFIKFALICQVQYFFLYYCIVPTVFSFILCPAELSRNFTKNKRAHNHALLDDSKILYVLGHDSRRAMTPRKSLLLRLSSLTFPTYDFVVCAHMSLIHLTYFFKVTFTCAYSLGSM